MSPYREVSAAEALEAPTRDGAARLELAPRHLVLDVAGRAQLVVDQRFATIRRERGSDAGGDGGRADRAATAGLGTTGPARAVATPGQAGVAGRRAGRRRGRRLRRRKPKQRTLDLNGHRLVVARGVPTAEIGVWWEARPGVVTRVFGVRPVELMDDDALDAWRALDRLAGRLDEALAPRRAGIETAFEVGAGADRVLVTDDGDCLVMYVRRLFREWPRVALEVHRDGRVVVAGRFGATTRCTSRYGVTIAGDYIRFADDTGEDRAIVSVPWVSTVEREELARRFGDRVHRDPVDGRPPTAPWL